MLSGSASQCLSPESDEFVDIGSTLNNIGACLHALSRFPEAFTYFESAREIMADKLDLVQCARSCVLSSSSDCAVPC